MKNNENLIKGIGLLATVLGVVATLASDYVANRKMENKIEEQVDLAVANYFENKES